MDTDLTGDSMKKSALFCLCALTLLIGAACSGDDSENGDSGGSGDSSGSGGDASSFCDDFKEAGGTLATVGIYQTGLPKESAESDLGNRARIMNAVTPPDEIAEAWQAWLTHYEAVLDVAAETEPGMAVFDPELNTEALNLNEEHPEISDYLNDHCF